MPCDEYKRLDYERKSAMEQWAQFTYPENRHLRGVSDRKAKEIAKEARATAQEKGIGMHWHRENCPECKGESSASAATASQ